MNYKAKKVIKNFYYTVSSNLISLLISTLVVLIVPKLIGVEEYGYWQLYIFYSSYVGFLQFGWTDGIYLRYGGEEYKDIDKKLFFSQFWMLFSFQIIISILILSFTNIWGSDINRIFILRMVSLCLVLTGIRAMLIFTLQATNRIKEYARVTMIGRLIYFSVIIFFVILSIREYRLMIVADLLGRLVSLIFAMYYCKEIVFRKVTSFVFTIQEMLENINAGIKLMFANIASMLIIGVVRFGIERSWDVETFGKISLTLSASNLMMIFINAVGVIMFPILRKTNEKRLPEIYTIMRDFLMIVLLGLLAGYYPLKNILSDWLPKYSESLMYMALVFPMFIYEGKMALLINTYLKTLRKEKMMLKINLISVALSLLLTLLTTVIIKKIDFAILTIVFLLAIRSILAELYLSKLLMVKLNKDITFELSLTIVFILSGWYINSWMTLVVYGTTYFIYLLIKRKDISATLRSIKKLMKA
jgi:O-antigen/teichoic acid export membrane protein